MRSRQPLQRGRRERVAQPKGKQHSSPDWSEAINGSGEKWAKIRSIATVVEALVAGVTPWIVTTRLSGANVLVRP
jgi:hypothetical protein